MDDKKMEDLIVNIGEPIFVGTAGLYEQFFDHIDVHVELNKEGRRPALRESLAFFNKEIPERLSRDEKFVKYGVPIERLELWELMSDLEHRVLDFSFKIKEMYVKKVKFVFFDPDGPKKRAKHTDGTWSRVYAEKIQGLTRKMWNNVLLTIAACAIDTKQKIMYEYGAEQPVKVNKTNVRNSGKRVVRRIWEEIDVPSID